MFWKPPRIASALPPSSAGSRLRPTFDLLTSEGSSPALREDRLQVVALVGDAGGRDGLAAQVGGARDPGRGQRDQRGQRLVDDRGDRLDVEPLLAGEQHLGLVGDREVGAPRGDLLDRRRGIGGDLRLDVEPGALEVAVVERHVDPGVVGVDVEVEREVEVLRLGRAERLLLLAAGGQARARARERRAAATSSGRLIGPPRRSASASQVTTRRSSSASSANRQIAIAESTTIAANERAVSSCAVAPESIRCPSPSPEPAHSPKTAPITATATAIFAPLKAKGSAEGASTRRRICSRLGAQRPHHLDLLGVDRAQAVEGVDGDREEADERDDRQLRPDPEAEPDDEDRRDHDHRDRLGGDQQRIEGAPQRLGEVEQRRRSRARATSASGEAEHDLLQRHPGVVGEQRAVLPERRRRSRSARGPGSPRSSSASASRSQLGGELPERRAGRATTAGGASRRAARGSRRASRPSARSASLACSSANSGEVTAAARSAARGAGDVELGRRPAPGRGVRTSDAVGEVERLLDVVGDEQRPCGGRPPATPREPLLHLGAGDRVERGERLVEQQHRLAGDQGAQEGDPLAHPAGELGRAARPRSRPSPRRSNSGAGASRRAPRASGRRPAAPARRCRRRESQGSSRSRCGM